MVTSAESMLRAVKELGIVPFFQNPIRGYSIEELTPPEFWFDGDSDVLGPWDWKVDCVQSSEIAYGKFLWGGKAAFATPLWYKELMNYRRSLPKYSPDAGQKELLTYLEQNGTISSKDIRRILGVKKSAADSVCSRLQMQCRLITGDITRVYRGPDLHYNGWQLSSFCNPEALFGPLAPATGQARAAHLCAKGPGGFPFVDDDEPEVRHSPEESYRLLFEHVKAICAPAATDAQIAKMLG